MCGIIGITGKESNRVEKERLEEMLNSLFHRGPDDKGLLSFPLATLGQTRLSIIDLSSGHQPMKDSFRNMAISFNGEIYNYKKLRRSLEDKGYSFSTTSDTEVILKAYQEYGPACLEHLDGMFALAIWDEGGQELFLARDRFGKKPLYYSFDKSGNFIFASEIKALFKSGLIKGELDYRAIDDYLRLLYIPPWKSVYKNIKPLPPAHYAVVKGGQIEIKRYWHMPYRPIKIERNEAKKKIVELLREATKKRLMASDVEVGAFLSGGIDSSLVSYFAQKELSGGKRLKTFSVGFEKFINELPYAEEVAKKICSEQYSVNLKEKIPEYLQEVTRYFDEPFADSSMIPQYLVSRIAREKVKVVLSGDGADELFLGYGWQFKEWQLGLKDRLKQKLFSNPFKDYLSYTEQFTKKERLLLWKDGKNIDHDFPSFPPTENKNPTAFDKINMLDVSLYLPGDILTKVDRMSMMNSLEVRSPFLDTKLAEFVYNLPLEYKFNPARGGGKSILKEVFGEYFGENLARRRKQGFGAPVYDWLKKEDVEMFVREKIGEKGNAMIFDFLDKNYVQEIIGKLYDDNDHTFAYKVWILVCLELWVENNKENFA